VAGSTGKQTIKRTQISSLSCYNSYLNMNHVQCSCEVKEAEWDVREDRRRVVIQCHVDSITCH
jgi:hypothetical protein